MRRLSDHEQRHLMLRRAPELALSGNFKDAREIAMHLRREGVDVRRHFTPATYEWLDELCQRAAAQAAE